MSRKRNTIETIIARVAVCEHGFACTVCCWPWLGVTDKDGYGKVGYNNTLQQAPRLIFCLLNNIPLDMKFYTCHTCDNSSCCNWSHLYKGSAVTNNIDTVTHGRANRVQGEAHHQAKMTAAQVHEARTLYATGNYTIAELCNYYPIKRSQMQRILKGQKWFN